MVTTIASFEEEGVRVTYFLDNGLCKTPWPLLESERASTKSIGSLTILQTGDPAEAQDVFPTSQSNNTQDSCTRKRKTSVSSDLISRKRCKRVTEDDEYLSVSIHNLSIAESNNSQDVSMGDVLPQNTCSQDCDVGRVRIIPSTSTPIAQNARSQTYNECTPGSSHGRKNVREEVSFNDSPIMRPQKHSSCKRRITDISTNVIAKKFRDTRNTEIREFLETESREKNIEHHLSDENDGENSVRSPSKSFSESRNSSDENSSTRLHEPAIDEYHGPFDNQAVSSPAPLRRKANPEQWKKVKRKRKKYSGQGYTSTTGLKCPRKSFRVTVCDCGYNCPRIFTSKPQRTIWNHFNKLGEYSLQNQFIHDSTKSCKPKRKRMRSGRRSRKRVVKYFFRKGNLSYRVCRRFFLGVLDVSSSRVQRCTEKSNIDDVRDKRGTLTKSTRDYSSIIDHINSFPRYQSHYSRKDNPNMRYLPSNLNISIMYKLYVEDCGNKEITPLPERCYRDTFNNQFNLKFKHPHSDTCKTCDSLKMRITEETDEMEVRGLKEQLNAHHLKAELARSALKEDKKKVSPQCYVFTFDLQKQLPFPILTTSIAYYKRSMYVYNLGIHTFNEGDELGKGYMYMYDETEGGRGSQDIASCLVTHIVAKASHATHIIMWSDMCTGQNRNIKVTLSLMKLLQRPDIEADIIDHKFPVSGHSFLPNDTDFGAIERASKNKEIFVPDDWINVVREAKWKHPRFEVVHMSRDSFLSTEKLVKSITNRKKTVNKEKFNWLKIVWFRYERASPFKFKFKYTLDPEAEFQEVDLAKNTRGRPLQSLMSVQQDKLYPTRRIVKTAKKNDMKDLLPYIPSKHHKYFKDLPVETPIPREKTTRQRKKKSTSEDKPVASENDDEFEYD
ncbi:hypothetical protein QAD02_024263 [Eretmocerus hayati]|uniref:Uncharacterized protein n=1 Tax=Eretmocerus hayati TaxID=131215 RepID=A0ACC2PZT9_9HYME|nr:hypothetical protein QAD02_024263 [Eretmocerus hayati]